MRGMTTAPDPRAFLYHDGQLDPAEAQRLTAAALAKADDGELYLQYSKSEAFGFDDGRLKTADYSIRIPASACAPSRARRPPLPMPMSSAPPRSAAPPRRWR